MEVPRRLAKRMSSTHLQSQVWSLGEVRQEMQFGSLCPVDRFQGHEPG